MAPPPQILLVDDLPGNLVALKAVLQEQPATVLEARSGREALEILLVEEIALAIVDVQMPEMDGFELAELMRGTERTREVPIIFVTAGLHDQARVFRGYESGGVDFLHKPLDARVLRSKVGVFLQLARQRQLLAEQVRELERVDAELREADRRKDEFLGVLSHELRNPLAPIRNSIFILRRGDPASPEGQRAYRIIERQVDHLARIVDDLLDITRITTNKVQLRQEDLDLAETVRRITEDHRAGFVAAGIDLDVRLPAAPVWAYADPTRVAQAIGNLLSNAGKFTPAGGHVVVELTTVGPMAVLRVVDDGAGLAPELCDSVFERFRQADQTLDRSQGGLGLGLALVKGMIELHGGSVSAHSDGPGLGATFTIRLPLGRSGNAAAGRDRRAARPRSVQRIVLIEDNADSAASLQQVLELMGHEVHVARDGVAGIALVEASPPTVVLCDIGLPGMDGFEIARRLRALHPALPLIALSGYAMPEDRRRAREAGFSHHLPKPLALEELQRLFDEL